MSEQSTELAKKPETAMARVKNYILSPEVKERFANDGSQRDLLSQSGNDPGR